MTAAVSEAELAALIASLNGAPAAPPATEAPRLGPWIAATYRGACAGCGSRIEEFDEIRSDGDGGWLARCCGDIDTKRPANPAAGLIAPAPAPCLDPFCAGTPGGGCGLTPQQHLERHGVAATVAAGRPSDDSPASAPPTPAPAPVRVGPPDSTVRELRQVLIDFEAQRPRSMQKALGPSELGTPCQQQIARKLAGAPRVPITAPTWAPFQGTAVHASMEDVVAFWNRQLGRERWLAEDRLVVHPGLPDVDAIEGNGDAFDTDWDMVVDWKHTGKTAREKLRRAKRLGKHPAEQVSAEYRVQGHLYGLGHERKGRRVRYVRLVLLARDYDYDQSEEWTEPYNADIAYKAIARYYELHDVLASLGGTQCGDLIAAVPSAPHRDTCKWCPFYTPGQPTSWAGCAGDRPPARHVELATAGLIAPTASGAAVAPAEGLIAPFTKETQ